MGVACTREEQPPVVVVAKNYEYQGEYDNKGRMHSDHGKITFNNGDVFIGSIINGIRNGNGTLLFDSGLAKFEGNFESDLFKHGRLTTSQEVYEGDFANGMKNGIGKLVSKEGWSYTGEFKDDKRNGEGVIEFNEDDYFGRIKYKGSFVDDMKEGFGELYFIQGHYKGNFQNDSFSGNGSRVLPSGKTFTGTWERGLLVDGKITTPDGVLYEGSFKTFGSKTKPHGDCCAKYPDGSFYRGSWSKGKRSGFGLMHSANGDEFEGQWVDDEQCGGHCILRSHDATFEGELKDKKRCGVGNQIWISGNEYTGEWINDLPHGQGKMKYVVTADGEKIEPPEIYEGAFENGKPKNLGKNFVLAAMKLGSLMVQASAQTADSEMEHLRSAVDGDDICVICNAGPIATLYLECAHMAACQKCAKTVKKCPICNQRIVRVIRIYSA